MNSRLRRRGSDNAVPRLSAGANEPAMSLAVSAFQSCRSNELIGAFSSGGCHTPRRSTARPTSWVVVPRPAAWLVPGTYRALAPPPGPVRDYDPTDPGGAGQFIQHCADRSGGRASAQL